MNDTPVHRRRLLATAAAAIGGLNAGCTGASPPTRETPTPRPTPDVDATPSSDRDSPTDNTSQYTDVYREVAPSVVEIMTTGEGVLPGQGSGFLYDDHTIVTNQHVVGNAPAVDVGFQNHEWEVGTVLGADEHSDLAVLEVDSLPLDSPSLSFTDGVPEIGTEVMAIGSPFGLGGSASTGIVSGVNRSLPSPTGFSIPAAIQTDAAVNPGNSGGPLVTLTGAVVGVVFAGAGSTIGFAISSPLVHRVLPTLTEEGRYEHSFMGVRLLNVTPPIAAENDLERAFGVYIVEIITDSPSDGILRGATDETFIDGIHIPIGGDVILAIDGTDIPTLDFLSAHLALETRPGDTIELSIIRNGTEQSVDLTLGNRPE